MAFSSSNLEISVEAPGGLERRVTVRVPTADIEREVSVRLLKVGRTAKLKGFRPGKVPQKVVQQRFGGQVREEVLSDVVRSTFSRAIEQEKLNPAGGPRIEPLSGQGEEHFSYRATFEVYPEIALADISVLAVEVPVTEITDADVDAMIEKLRVQRAQWVPVERKAQAGDRVVVDYQGKIDKEPFPGGEGKNVTIVVGAGHVIEDFDKALNGVTAGESKSFKVKYPKDYPTQELAGKKAAFDLTVQRVEERELPELDQAFLEAFGVTEGGVERLRTEVRENMERELAERRRADVKRRVLDALLAANQIAVPRALIDQEITRLQVEAMRSMGIQDPKDAPARERFEGLARRRAALGMLVQELIRQHRIQIDPARVDQRIKELAAPFEDPQEAERVYRGSRELASQVEVAVLEDQVVDFLLERGKVEEKRVSFDEFMGA